MNILLAFIMAVSYNLNWDASVSGSITNATGGVSDLASVGTSGVSVTQGDSSIRPDDLGGRLSFVTNDRLTTSAASLDIGSGFAMVVVVDTSEMASYGYEAILTMDHTAGASYSQQVYIGFDNTGKIECWMNGFFATTSGVVSSDKHVIIMTGDPANGFKVFLDGVQVASNGNYNDLGTIINVYVNSGMNMDLYESGILERSFTTQEVADETARLDSKHFGPSAVVFSPNSISHSVTLEQSEIGVFYPISPNSILHANSLESSSISVNYVISPNHIIHDHLLESGVITSEGIVTFVPDSITHSHIIDDSEVSVSYEISPENLSHSHSIDGSGIDVNYAIIPEDVLHSVGLEDAGFSVSYEINPNDIIHGHILESAALIVDGDATSISVESKNLYVINIDKKTIHRISLDAKKIYGITLNSKPILQ